MNEDSKKAEKPSIVPLHSDFDREMINRGHNFTSGVAISLKSAVRQDLYCVLRKLAKNAKHDIQLGWIKGENCLEDMQDRIAKSLEYIVGDAESDQDFSESDVLSYEYGLKCVLDLALQIITALNCGQISKINHDPEARKLVNMIQACQMALIARGCVQQAFEIARLAGALKCFNDEIDPFQNGKYKKSFKYLQQLKILGIVTIAVNESIFPSKRCVRLKMQKSPMQESQFSRYMSELRINEILTKISYDLGSKEPKGDSAAINMSKAMQDLKIANVEKIGCVVIEKHLSLNPSGKSCLVDSDVMKIKDVMGPLYWFLLIQFGMGEIETKSELDMFEQKLSELGLSLK